MTLADRKWLQARLTMLMKESLSEVTVVLDLSEGFGESVTMAILAATDSMMVRYHRLEVRTEMKMVGS